MFRVESDIFLNITKTIQIIKNYLIFLLIPTHHNNFKTFQFDRDSCPNVTELTLNNLLNY